MHVFNLVVTEIVKLQRLIYFQKFLVDTQILLGDIRIIRCHSQLLLSTTAQHSHNSVLRSIKLVVEFT